VAVASETVSVAFIVPRYVSYGGGERFLERAIASLQARGVSIAIIAREWKPTEGVTVIPCDVFHVGRLWRDWAFHRKACRAVREHRFDLVQAHDRIACADVFRAGGGVHREYLVQMARASSPLEHAWARLDPYHRFMLAAERELYSSMRLRMVICNSEMVRDEIHRHYGISQQRLCVIRNGVNTEEFHPRLRSQRQAVRDDLEIPEHAFVFLFVGSGFKRKGLAQALTALAGLRDPTWLVVVGKDRREHRYRRLAARLGIAQRVRFLGSQRHVAPYYGAADAFVLPTLYDPGSNAVLEALAAGLPVITSTKCGTAELIQPGVNGFVCDALDLASLEHCMQELTGASLARFSKAAREAVEPYTFDAMAGAYASLYERLLKRPEPQPAPATR
jgi:UDP-glucose:(heptosyl)LPS alpha-1,3-glucosyltransferase